MNTRDTATYRTFIRRIVARPTFYYRLSTTYSCSAKTVTDVYSAEAVTNAPFVFARGMQHGKFRNYRVHLQYHLCLFPKYWHWYCIVMTLEMLVRLSYKNKDRLRQGGGWEVSRPSKAFVCKKSVGGGGASSEAALYESPWTELIQEPSTKIHSVAQGLIA